MNIFVYLFLFLFRYSQPLYQVEYDDDLTFKERIFYGIRRRFEHSHLSLLLLLSGIGTMAGLVSFSMEAAILSLYYVHISVTEYFAEWYFSYLCWAGFLFVLFHISFYIVKLIGPNAIGSGIPEMKSILNGVVLVGYLSFKTLVAKVFGLIAAIGGGLVVGREGPFVHISSIISDMFLYIPIFRYVRRKETLRIQILTAAIAAGMASNFGAPIGGLCFLFFHYGKKNIQLSFIITFGT